MSLQGFQPWDDDEACHLVGTFRRKALEQGWPEADIEEVCRGESARRIFSELSRFVEPRELEPRSWRTQFLRNRDYAEGCRMFATDVEAHFNPFRFLARGFGVAIRGRRP